MARGSSVARVLRALVVLVAAAGTAWLAWHWAARPALALGGALVVWFGYALVLAAEFVCLRVAGRRDPAPPPTAGQLVRAWLVSIWHNGIVFGWHQPFRWDAIPDHVPAAPGSPPRRGIVLVHGFVCNRGFWNPWLRELRRRGAAFVAVNLEPALGSIDDYPGILEDAIVRLTRATGLAPLVVCHSMGGVAVRAWLRSGASLQRVHHIVTIGSPHRGTWLGRCSRARNARELSLGGPWMRELERALPASAGAAFTCWYSNCDNMVFPVSTATLPGASNRLLPGAGHLELAYRREVMDSALAMLAH